MTQPWGTALTGLQGPDVHGNGGMSGPERGRVRGNVHQNWGVLRPQGVQRLHNSHFILVAVLQGQHDRPQFVGKATEAQRGQMICPSSDRVSGRARIQTCVSQPQRLCRQKQQSWVFDGYDGGSREGMGVLKVFEKRNRRVSTVALSRSL